MAASIIFNRLIILVIIVNMSKSTSHDDLYAKAQGHIVDFAFDEAVVNVFPDMIRRSVPGYDTIITLLGLLAQHYAVAGSRCYDLGCSLGAASLAIQDKHNDPGEIAEAIATEGTFSKLGLDILKQEAAFNALSVFLPLKTYHLTG